MKDPLFQSHTRYFYKGIEVPPCTVVASYGPQPWLAKWAWAQGRANKPLEAKMQWAGQVGGIAHRLVHGFLTATEVDLSVYRPVDVELAKQLAEGLISMVEGIIPVKMEFPCSSPLYGGTPDLLGKLPDGRHVLIDYKTGKGVYQEHYLQVAAYARMITRQHMELVDDSWVFMSGLPVDEVWILHVPNTGGAKEKRVLTRELLRRAWDAFRARLRSYYADLRLKEVL